MNKTIAWMLCMTLTLLSAQERGLNSFEGSFTKSPEVSKPKPAPKPIVVDRTNVEEEREGRDPYWLELVVYVGMALLAAGGMNAHEIALLREPGDPVLPQFRVEAFAQAVDSDIWGMGYEAEAGFGAFALQFRHSHFMEDETDDTLDWMQAHFLYRMAITSRLETDLAFGSAWLSGEHTKSGFSFGTPVRWWPYDRVGVEVRPYWTTLDDVSLRDIEASLLLRHRNVSLRFGYRWLENGDASLGGPIAGLSLRF